ncbi:MAG: insulinase family protein [Chloracidobacterium sp.]|nr:insulinase family protein [Chloracidobacterium sp.]
MKNRELFVKIVFIAVIALLLISLVAPVIFSQTPREEKLLNGLKVLMWPDAKADKVAVRIRIHSGSAFDPQGKEGLMQMLANNLFPNQEIREYFAEDLGGSLDVSATYDYIEVSVSAKPEFLLQMLETVAGAVATPPIDKPTTVTLRDMQIAKVKELETDVAYVADRAAAKRLLGDFPYGRPHMGNVASLGKIEYADLVDARQRFLTADNATMTISGNFDRKYAFLAIRRLLGGWQKGDKKVPSTFRQPDEPPVAVLTVPSPKPEAWAIRMAMRGAARSDKDFAASLVFAQILESRLKASVPDEHAKDVIVVSETHVLPGLFRIAFGAISKDITKVEANEIVPRALSAAVTTAEFQATAPELRSIWAKRPVETFWLDADTLRITDVDAYRKAFESVTLADVNAFAERLRRRPIVTVLANTPPAAN